MLTIHPVRTTGRRGPLRAWPKYCGNRYRTPAANVRKVRTAATRLSRMLRDARMTDLVKPHRSDRAVAQRRVWARREFYTITNSVKQLALAIHGSAGQGACVHFLV
jgi:predicted Ser/Thr protein kinase